MKPIQHLDIIENHYQVVNWYVEPSINPRLIHSDLRKFEGMNELQDYKDCGVYHRANVPFSIYEVQPEKYPEDEPYLAFARSYSDLVCESIKKGNIQLFTGSYCTHIPSILGGIRRAAGAGKKIGVIWMDAHADNYIVENTSVKRLRLLGVPMSAFLSQTLPDWQEAVGLVPPISGENVIASDIRYKDSESQRNLRDAGVQVIEQCDFQNAVLWEKAVQKLAAKVDVIFMHVDADILHHDYLPAYEYDVVHGNELPIVRKNIAAVMKTGKVLGTSVMCIGFENQDDRKRDVNNMNGIRLVSSVLSNWTAQPEL